MTLSIALGLSLPVLALALSALLAKGCIWALPKLGMLDRPSEIKIHGTPTPRGGGLAIICTVFISWTLLVMTGLFSSDSCYKMGAQILIAVAGPAALLALTGLCDDKWGLKALQKLSLQTLAAVLTWFLGVKFTSILGVPLNDLPSLLLTTLWIVAFINAFNLIDGMDGLAGGLGAVAGLCIGIKFMTLGSPASGILMLCFAAACIGFLKYNFHPAKLFMGDTGSMFIGYVIAVSGLVSISKMATMASVLIPILAAGVPVFDTFLAVWRRSTGKLLSSKDAPEIMSGDAEHLHHRLYRSNLNQRLTTVSLYALASCFAAAAILLMLLKDVAQNVAFVLILLVFVAVIRYLAAVELWNSARAIMLRAQTFRNRAVLGLCYPFLDMSLFIGSYYLVTVVLGTGIREGRPTALELLLAVAPPMVMMVLGGVYKHLWTRTNVFAYVRLLWLVATGELLGLLITLWIYGANSIHSHSLALWLLFLLLSQTLIMGYRVLLRLFKTYLVGIAYMNRLKGVPSEKIIIYGAGLNCLLFLTCRLNDTDDAPVEIVGLLDDDDTIWGRYVYGLKVAGGLANLEDVHVQTEFKRILLTIDLPQEKLKAVKAFCLEHGIALSSFSCVESRIDISEGRPA